MKFLLLPRRLVYMIQCQYLSCWYDPTIYWNEISNESTIDPVIWKVMIKNSPKNWSNSRIRKWSFLQWWKKFWKISKNLRREAQTSLQRNPNQWWSPGEPCSDHFHTTRDMLLHLDKNRSSFQDVSKRQTKGTSGRPERNLVILELLIQKWVPSVTYNNYLEPMIKPSLSLSKKQRSSSDTILHITLVTQYSNICSQVEYNWSGI